MNAHTKLLSLGAIVAALLGSPAAASAQSETRLGFGPGSDYPGPPIYAQISYSSDLGWEIYHTDEWAAIPFYRDPGCVPQDFNLLQMFNPPVAFDCPLAVRGFEIWASEPPPIKMKTWGLGAVSIYFVKWPKLQEAVDDFELTMAELNALVASGDALIGTASFFEGELHPSGGTAVPHIQISAYGRLADNRRFQFQVAGGDQSVLVRHIRIVFE